MRSIPVTLALALCVSAIATAGDFVTWGAYGGDNGNSHYSSLAQINRDNIGELKPAWRYASAGGRDLPASSELQLNPIVVNGVLYGRNPLYNVFAIDAATGEERWRYDSPGDHVGMSNMRGLNFWRRRDDQRILFTTGHYLEALDAVTGAPVKSFGDNGRVDLRQGLGRDPDTISINVPSPGVVYGDLLILGSAVTETRGAAPGDIRAYRVDTGELAWRFHTIAHPGEYGYDTWPEGAWQTAGGANAWAGLSLDTARGVVYAPTGSPTPDFNGSQRAGANLFGNSIIALDAASGERLWHYQTVHHDLWDRDLSSAPTLATINHNGNIRDVVIQASKQGVLYVLDRDSGEPIWPIDEVSVPASPIPGEQAYPTQPRVTLPEPFARQTLEQKDLSNLNPESHAHVLAQFREAQSFAYMRPPGLKKTILFPGFYGGANWGGGAFDPASNVYYINATEAPHLIHMEAMEVDRGSTMGTGEFLFRQQCSGCHGLDLQGFYPYAPALVGIHERLEKHEAIAAVRQGKGRMMPFNHLNDHELDAVVDYLMARSAGPLPEGAGDVANVKETETVYVFAGYNDFVDQRFYPAVAPPWGTVNAIDMTSGKRLWQITLGEYEQLTAEGIAPTGTRNYGGPVVTAGGLLIIAASSDAMLRIFDKNSGELLWQYALPAAGYATPATYEIEGRQYIVITCSGGKLGTPTGDQYLAFALPQLPADQTSSAPP